MMDFGIPSRILINGGGPVFGAFEDISLDAWDLYINQVIKSNVIILKKLLPQMNNNGSIVFILSDVVRNAGPGKILPCSLRMALIGIIKCLAFEYAEKNIRINAVSPGPVETERAVSLLNKSAENNNISFNEMKNEFTKDLPMKRMGRPEEIAELVNFLFSDKSTYITGANIICDGGLTVMPV
jgi:3-oxoacyl-[acyl-carrier protein] reductase